MRCNIANDALYALSPDCNRDEWFKIATAYKSGGGVFETFDNWSKQSQQKYSASTTHLDGQARG